MVSETSKPNIIKGIIDYSGHFGKDRRDKAVLTTNVGMLGRFHMYYYQKPVLIGEIIVNSGDWIFGDIDGAICVPGGIAYDVLVKAEEILYTEDGIRKMVENGMRPTEVAAKGGYF